nr:hypothetical protein CFP56_68291 [Quercus suber]
MIDQLQNLQEVFITSDPLSVVKETLHSEQAGKPMLGDTIQENTEIAPEFSGNPTPPINDYDEAALNSEQIRVHVRLTGILKNLHKGSTRDRCKLEPESALHSLWTCTELEVVGEDVVKWGFRGPTSFLTFKELPSWLIKNSQHVDLFAVTAWSIWNQRNQVRMYQPSCSLHLFAATAKDRLDEFLSIQPAPRPTPPRQRIQWQAPPQGMVMINFDGAMSTKTLSSGIGVVRDDSGSVLGALSQHIPQVVSPLGIDAKAASRALQFASELGFNQVILEGDCQQQRVSGNSIIDSSKELTGNKSEEHIRDLSGGLVMTHEFGSVNLVNIPDKEKSATTTVKGNEPNQSN